MKQTQDELSEQRFWRKMIGPRLGEDKKLESLALPFNGGRDPEKIRMAMWGAKTLEEANEIASRHAASIPMQTENLQRDELGN